MKVFLAVLVALAAIGLVTSNGALALVAALLFVTSLLGWRSLNRSEGPRYQAEDDPGDY